jgi:hypothetical protein
MISSTPPGHSSNTRKHNCAVNKLIHKLNQNAKMNESILKKKRNRIIRRLRA